MYQQCKLKLQKTMRGAVAVELALLSIPLLVLALGAAEFGQALYQYNTLVKTTRDAVRHLSQLNPAGKGYAEAQSEAKCLAVYGNTKCEGDPLVSGLTTDLVSIKHYANVTTDPDSTSSPTISLVEVGISGYSFNFLFDPGAFLFLGGGEKSITFGDIRATMRQS
ncbi:pilus assembly protein [Nitrosomonas communis]|uniref:TadE/TadG family type IV pilus assembly protein n=1 Tax=Nitrosomonas communis TaxID=44574 RepID=UPI0026EC1AE9|nr:pilus assembly protein [Nitrosomonas communis]MCO6428421.1 pilus assembly protein [Nitrosomonas communis]